MGLGRSNNVTGKRGGVGSAKLVGLSPVKPISSFFTVAKRSPSLNSDGQANIPANLLGKRKASLLADMSSWTPEDLVIKSTPSPKSKKRAPLQKAKLRTPSSIIDLTGGDDDEPASKRRHFSQAEDHMEGEEDKENVPPVSDISIPVANTESNSPLSLRSSENLDLTLVHDGYPLPKVYEDLIAIFEALEYTMAFARGRGQLCSIFHHIQKPVENVCRKKFTLDHLAQIMYLYPDVFDLKPVRVCHQGAKVDSIAIYPAKSLVAENENNDLAEKSQLTAPKVSRSQTLRKLLLEQAHKIHQKFCEIHNINAAHFSDRWVDGFDFSKVPSLPLATLPSPSVSDANEKLQLMYRQKPVVPKPTAIEEVEMAHLSRSEALLARIRRKEKSNLFQTTLSPQQLRRNAMISRLPEIVHCTIMYFNSMAKRVIYISAVADSVSMSLQRSKLSSEQVELHIKLLADIVPNLLEIMDSDNGTLVRLDKTYPQRDALALIQKELRLGASPSLIAALPAPIKSSTGLTSSISNESS